MNSLNAAEEVLQEAGHPMRPADIAQRMLELGLWQTNGKTPGYTIDARISVDIKEHGLSSLFQRTARGTFALRDWGLEEYIAKPFKKRATVSQDIKPVEIFQPVDPVTVDVGLALEIEQHNNEVRLKLRERLYALTPGDFEALIGSLLTKIGFERVEVTNISKDGGIDVRGTLVVAGVIRTNMAVQAKRWKNNVQAPTIQQVRGSLGTHDQGLIITTSDFSSGARQEAERPNAVPVALMNGEQLVTILVEHNIGISRISYDLIELSQETEE